MSATIEGNTRLKMLEGFLKELPGMEQVKFGTEINMVDGKTLLNVILIYKTVDDEPPDLNIHVSDNISVEAHYGGAPE